MTDLIADVLNNPIVPAIGLAVGATVVALWLAYIGLLASAWIVLPSPFLLPLSLAGSDRRSDSLMTRFAPIPLQPDHSGGPGRPTWR